MRSFAKKKKGSKKDSDASATEGEEDTAEVPEEPVVEPVVEKATPPPPPPKAAVSDDFADAGKPTEAQAVDKSLYSAFTVGDVKQVQSTENHKPPFRDDSVPGRYAEVLFTTASSQGSLYDVYEDVIYIQALYKNCESF